MEAWEREVRRGILSVLVLSILARGPKTVDEIRNFLSSHDIDMPIGTIYPLLKRLERSSLVKVIGSVKSGKGKPRNLYEITPIGKETLERLKEKLTKILEKTLELLWESHA